MTEILLKFDASETTLSRVERLSAELGITPEEWVHRAIAKELGAFGLNEVPAGANPKTLTELFVLSGVLKSEALYPIPALRRPVCP